MQGRLIAAGRSIKKGRGEGTLRTPPRDPLGQANQPSRGWIRPRITRGEAGYPQNSPRDPTFGFSSGLSGFFTHTSIQRVPERWAATERVWTLLSRLLESPPPSPDCHPTEGGQTQSYVCVYVCVCGRRRPPAARRGGRRARVPKIPNYKCFDLDVVYLYL